MSPAISRTTGVRHSTRIHPVTVKRNCAKYQNSFKPEQKKKNKVHVQQLIVCLQDLKQTGVSSEYYQDGNGNNKREPIKKFKGEGNSF